MQRECRDSTINLYEALKCSADKFPGKVAVIDSCHSVTYQELQNKADILAYYLRHKFHLSSGDRVGFLFVNSIEFYIAFYAAMKIGLIAVMVNTKMQKEEIAFTLGDTQTHCLIMNARWFPKIKDNIQKLAIDKIIFEQECEIEIEDLETDSMEHIFTASDTKDYKVPIVKKEDMTAVIMHTSGTTGQPKGVMISHVNIMGAACGYQKVLKVDEHDISVLSVPVFHILGLSCVSNLFIAIGGTLVVFERYDSNQILKAIEKYHATHFHSVPAIYIKMLQERKKEYDLSSLRLAVCGGAIISEENVEAFCKIAPNASFRIAYGLTETAGSGVLSYCHRAPGKEVSNCTLKIQTEGGKILRQQGQGEAVFAGEIVTTRIWGKQEPEKECLHTGDIVVKDENGFIYVKDRIKDVINRGGEKLFPSIIEKTLLGYENVTQAVVFAVGDAVYGEVPAAILTVKENAAIDLQEIRKDLPNQLGKFEIPKYIEVWKQNEIPFTGNGKVKKKKLREIFESRLEMAKNGEEKGDKDEKA